MNSHLSEAYFLRGLCHFYLVRNFKEAPIVTEPYVDDSAPYDIAKSSEEDIIAQIKSDIQTALDTGAAKEFFEDDKWEGASKGRATKWALYALMADVCLWSEDYDGCIEYANQLINATASRRPVFMAVPEQWINSHPVPTEYRVVVIPTIYYFPFPAKLSGRQSVASHFAAHHY